MSRDLFLDKESGDKFCIFRSEEDVTGEVQVQVQQNSEFEHIGVNIELIGKIGNPHEYNFLIVHSDYTSAEFINLSKELEPPGTMTSSCKYNFIFKKVTFPYETYDGTHATIKYIHLI